MLIKMRNYGFFCSIPYKGKIFYPVHHVCWTAVVDIVEAVVLDYFELHSHLRSYLLFYLIRDRDLSSQQFLPVEVMEKLVLLNLLYILHPDSFLYVSL